MGVELLHGDGRTDGHKKKLLAVFSNFAKAPKNETYILYQVLNFSIY